MNTASAESERRVFPRDFRLYLASSSPRRRQLLESIRLPFEVVPSSAVEATGCADSIRLAEENALCKAEGASLPSGASPGGFVLGADTIVVCGGVLMGKPASCEEARRMIGSLQGRLHEVITGVALLRHHPSGVVGEVGSAVTRVRFRSLNEREIDAYLAGGEWGDKAGAYGIQGVAALLVDGIEGEYSNVVGLPLSLTFELFLAHGFDILAAQWTAASA